MTEIPPGYVEMELFGEKVVVRETVQEALERHRKKHQAIRQKLADEEQDRFWSTVSRETGPPNSKISFDEL